MTAEPATPPARPRTVQLHLVDATYELFRAHFAPRPPVLGRDGIPLSGVSGLCDQLLYLLREEGATHVGCATDRVIESFRNDLFPGYKSSAGMPPELLAQFPIAEAAVEALGIVLWPMVEFEADDAIAAAAVRFAEDPAVEKILVCTPDKDMAQLVRDERVVLWDRRREPRLRRRRRPREMGRRRRPRSRTGWPSSATRPTAIPGIPGWGAKSAAAVLTALRPPRGRSRRRRRRGRCRGSAARGRCRWPRRLRDHWDEALLYRDLARLRTAEDGVPIRQTTPTSCAGTARRAPSGRPSARNGASTGSRRDPIAGCEG